MKRLAAIMIALALIMGGTRAVYAQGVQTVYASKVLVGGCSNCQSDPAGPWSPGSVIRWRIGVANPNTNTLAQCTLVDQLPPGFSYAGNERYWLGHLSSPVLTANDPSCCSLSHTVPPQIGANSFVHPTVGSNSLTWNFHRLPRMTPSATSVPNATIINYFVIEFDVLVGNVTPGPYCNFFTFHTQSMIQCLKSLTVIDSGIGIECSDDIEGFESVLSNSLPTTSTSNLALVTISNNPAGTAVHNIRNPYLTGERGNWYPNTTWSYLTDRDRNDVAPYATNIREDGAFHKYQNFWMLHPTLGWKKFINGWQWVETVTRKDVNGLTIETSDVLGRHNALLTGYKNKLVIAEAGNARINEIMFDGFEDVNYLSIGAYCDTVQSCIPRIVNWSGVLEPDGAESHSGNSSGKLSSSGLGVTIPILPSTTSDLSNIADPVNGNGGGGQALGPAGVPSQSQNHMAEEGPSCAGIFMPTAGKHYVICAWVHDKSDPLATTFTGPGIQIGGSMPYRASGNIIDGWQRIYGEFDLPSTAASLAITFLKGPSETWFDDIRIFPYDGKMITYVYDGNTQKLTYTLDENNYFTKYNYDTSENLESINKETEKGVQTVKEARSSTVKRP